MNNNFNMKHVIQSITKPSIVENNTTYTTIMKMKNCFKGLSKLFLFENKNNNEKSICFIFYISEQQNTQRNNEGMGHYGGGASKIIYFVKKRNGKKSIKCCQSHVLWVEQSFQQFGAK
uniref:Uncharacterized protein n=1 Tax=Cacopsylla melanoneura TaxID=428564 RepID=A0A8D9ED05_9HEMI